MKITAKAVVLSEGYTATTDYFILPFLAKLGYETSLLDSRALPEAFNLIAYQLIVISRYLSGQQLAWLEKYRQSDIKIVYFMDDDLFDFQSLQGLPWRYQWKIFTKALKHRSRLQQLCDEIWLSTPYLAEKYARLHPVLLNPAATLKTLESKKPVQVCYHGTASHQGEIDWLLPVIAAVQSRSDNVHFDLFGSHAVAKAVNKLPRVSVLHQMTWPNYLAFTSTQKRDIALAPLLGSAFNAARGPTKFYDYARMGAIGLYSDVSPYQEFIRDDVDGFLLDNEPLLWVEKILQLADNKLRRETMLAQIKQRLL